jgi:hypothetical protein
MWPFSRKQTSPMPENSSPRVTQEFYCSSSGGGCGVYFDVRLNVAINRHVEIICPKCGHQHCRHIVNGVIKEVGRDSSKIAEQIKPTKASIRKEPITQTMMANKTLRDGAVHDAAAAQRRLFTSELWQSLADTEKGDY